MNPEVEKMAKRLYGSAVTGASNRKKRPKSYYDPLENANREYIDIFHDLARYVLRRLAKARKDERRRVLDEIAEEGKKFRQGFAYRPGKEVLK